MLMCANIAIPVIELILKVKYSDSWCSFIQREAVQDETFGLKYSDLVRSQDFSHLSNDHVDRLELNISAGHKLIGVGTVNIYNIYSLLYLQVII